MMVIPDAPFCCTVFCLRHSGKVAHLCLRKLTQAVCSRTCLDRAERHLYVGEQVCIGCSKDEIIPVGDV
jgi:hypothetical protein